MTSPIQIQDVASFLLVTVMLKMVIGGVITDYLRRGFKKWLLRTEEDALIWLHYRNRAAGRGHRSKHPEHCHDDDCSKMMR